jgi:hypothetical protein
MPVTVIKAKTPSDDPIVQVAERKEGKIRDAFILAIAVLKDKINLEDLAEAMATGTTDTVLGMLNVDDALSNAMKGAGLEAGEASVRDAIQQTFAAGAKAAILQLPKQIQVDLSFNLMNPESVKFLEAYEFNLIQQVTKDTVDAIRQVIVRAFQEGGHPYEQAREIRSMIGLTARQEAAVENYRTALETGSYSQALDRALRDGRYDRGLLNAIAQGKELPQARIDAMVDRYSTRYVKYRAETIARTECLPGNTLVSAAMVGAIHRRWYDGPMVEFITCFGRKLSATPNHPMLTSRGWLAAGQIHEGDGFICDTLQQSSGPARDGDVQAPPTTLAEIFNSLEAVWVLERKRCTDAEFHGDGRDREVDTLTSNRVLSIGRFSPVYKPAIKNVFSPSDFATTRFCRMCHRLLSVDKQACLCVRANRNAVLLKSAFDRLAKYAEIGRQGIESFAAKIANLEFFYRQIVPIVRGMSASGEVALPGIFQRSVYTSSADYVSYPSTIRLHGFSYSSHAQAGQIEIDGIRSVRIRAFSGHVFNLSTPFGYFNIDQVYTGNSLRAANKGQRALWGQAKEQGLLPDTVLRRWIASGDAATCPICEDLDGSEVGMDEEFDDGILEPPAHPSCRCAVGLSFPKAA